MQQQRVWRKFGDHPATTPSQQGRQASQPSRMPFTQMKLTFTVPKPWRDLFPITSQPGGTTEFALLNNPAFQRILGGRSGPFGRVLAGPSVVFDTCVQAGRVSLRSGDSLQTARVALRLLPLPKREYGDFSCGDARIWVRHALTHERFGGQRRLCAAAAGITLNAFAIGN